MKLFFGSCLLVLLSCSAGCHGQHNIPVYNLDIEQVDSNGNPLFWQNGFSKQLAQAYPMQLDSVVKHSGKNALKLYSTGTANGFGGVTVNIPASFTGKQITLRGYVKTRDVTGGYAGLSMRLYGEDAFMGSDLMEKRGLTGTNNWKKLSITLPYSEGVETIRIGLILIGKGTAWVDDLSVEIDGTDIALANKKNIKPSDTAFAAGSNIRISTDTAPVEMLTALGQVWGFLKYYHPAVKAGNYNWDAELVKALPGLLAHPKKTDWLRLLEEWVESYPQPVRCDTCRCTPSGEVKLQPDYGDLFTPGYLSDLLRTRLAFIKDNSSGETNYYIELRTFGAARIRHEKRYDNMHFPDDAFRLLALYRYWSIIQYFYPYRDLIGEKWQHVLSRFIPLFLGAKNEEEYTLACLKLVASINDTHANIYANNPVMENFRGEYFPPFSVFFVENKLVVGSFLNDSLKQQYPGITTGDVITHIDGEPIEKRMHTWTALTPASNPEVQLRDLARQILRGNQQTVRITVVQKGQQITEQVLQRLNSFDAESNQLIPIFPAFSKGFKWIDEKIAYISGPIKDTDVQPIKKQLSAAHAFIIDLRGGVRTTPVFTLLAQISAQSIPFAMFSRPNVKCPGLFSIPKTEYILGENSAYHYKGKIYVLVNANTQSAAEYLTMGLQSQPNVTVIGSTTAGADGNVGDFFFPGGISTHFSGLGVYYPDHSPTQRSGIRIDKKVSPTVKGFREGRDEVLVHALELAKK